jgi:hypothetical protein
MATWPLKVLPSMRWAKYGTAGNLHLGFDKMKSSWILKLFFISRPYSFILVRFLPAVLTLAVFDFMAVIEAESANDPGWV